MQKTPYWNGNITWVTPSDLSHLESIYISSSKRSITSDGLASCGSKMLPVGSIILSTRAPIGSLAIAGKTLCTNQGCKGLIPKADVSSPFFTYVLLSSKRELNNRGKGTTFLEISGDELARFETPSPNIEEQDKIARFLDHETARIDALIAEQKWLIELLKEKRQAVISHAVTKGLDPTVPMKDSGVEWLGEVPEGWSVTKLKFITDLIIDCPHETPVYDPEGDYLVIRTADVDQGLLKPKQMYRLDYEQYLSRTRREPLYHNDIVYGREGERWGHAALVPKSNLFALGQRMMQFRTNDRIDPLFLMFQLNSVSIYRQGDVDTVGATSPHVNVSTIKNYQLMLPPLEEQNLIAKYLKTISETLDSLMQESIDTEKLLAERRTALISAAVTGKIDVRNWQSSASEPVTAQPKSLLETAHG